MSKAFTARCECGGLKVICKSTPDSLVQCHCSDCKARTGSPFGLGAYFQAGQFEIHGVSKRFVRKASSGADFTQFFCPACGTTLFWKTARHPDGLGVAAGNFLDLPDTPPSRSVFDDDRCAWLAPLNIPTFRKGRNSERLE
mgnify:FL=1